MEMPAFFKSKNPFPLEGSLKIRVDRKNLPSHKAMESAMKAKMPIMYQREVGHTNWYEAHYQKRCLKNAATGLHFAKEVVSERQPSSLSYMEFDSRGLYDPCSVIQKQKSEDFTPRPRRLKPLKKQIYQLKSEGALAKPPTPPNFPYFVEECIYKAKVESEIPDPTLLVPVPPVSPPPPCEFQHSRLFLTEPPDMLGDKTTKRWSKPALQGTPAHKPQQQNLKWEERLLTKLSKATAQWIVNNQPAWGRWVQGKPRGFRRQKYDWSSIKYVLTSESDMELLNEIEAEALVGSHIEIHEKKPETSLLAYYRGPSFHTRVLAIDDPSANNKTADRVSKKSFKPLSPVKRRGRLNSVVGKYSYTTQNIFEQDLYFGSARIVHQDKKDRLVMDNNYEYYLHLEQRYPRPHEIWSFRPPKKAVQRIQKGAIHWTSLPTSIEDFAQSGGEQQSSVSTGRKREGYRKSEDVSEIIQIRRTMLEQWKADWKLDPPWQSATIEGLSRGLVDVHVQNRINAILICASAVLERPQRLQQSSQEAVIGMEAGAKSLETEALPAKIQPLLKNNLFDEDAHVRMAAAVCFYAMGEWYQEAQDIMRNALLNGNSADSWAAAQALAMDGITSLHVIKRILYQIFDQKDDATEEQACLLLSQLSRHTGLVHCLLASELNSCQWKNRVLACKTFSRIPGSISQDLKNKMVQLMWTDWKFDVRRAAAKALGHFKLGKEVHDQLRKQLKRGDCRMRVEALTLIGWLRLMTSRLLPGFLQCFSDDFVAVRKEACRAAGALRIKEETVLKCLFKIMQTDPFWKIKALAIRALGQIGAPSSHLRDLLLWALHYEDDPGVRREACRSIIALNMQDETVQTTLQDRLILEPNELVKEEVSHAVKTFNFEQEEDQEVIQKIKDKITTLSQKDLVIEKVLKFREITKNTWHEAHRIYREKGDIFAYKEIRDIFLAVVQVTFTDQTQLPSRNFSKIWMSILNLLPWLEIPPNPWTQRAFFEALEIYKAEKEECAKKSKTTSGKQELSKVITSEETGVTFVR
ncbi:HEAT repeat-containing protein 4 isoform X1 [Anolis carolinensis]|uniref:HEAT repeat-containing protein 4 isoform X1 n=2 Tax=Anolis carolinensis TaxID=28377 RepID=UPI002F2B5522